VKTYEPSPTGWNQMFMGVSDVTSPARTAEADAITVPTRARRPTATTRTRAIVIIVSD
jgi:hypothetical protein